MWGAFGNAPIDVPPAARGGGGAAPAARTPAAAVAPRQRSIPRATGPQQFGGPVHAVKVSNDGLVYVADRPNRRVQVFTPDGKYVTQTFINRRGPSPQSAAGLAFSPDAQQQFLYVADYGNSHIAVLDRKSLQLLYQFGQRSEKPGDFQGPHHLAIDSKGNLYTGEVAPGARAQRFVLQRTFEHAAAQCAIAPAVAPRSAALGPRDVSGAPGQARGGYPPWTSTMASPYRVIPNWPRLGDIKPGAAIGIIPDGKGGTWLHHRSEPPILHIDASGTVDRRFGNGMFVQAHGFCQDRDGNFWAGDSGPFAGQSRDEGARVPAVQVQPRRQGAAVARQGRRLEGRHRHVHRSDRVRDRAQRRHHRGRRALAAADRRAAGRRSAGAAQDGRHVRRAVRQDGHGAGRVHGTARAGVRLAGTAVRRGSLEQPRADLRSQHAVRRRVAPLRPAERHRHPARTTRSSSRTPSRASSSAVRHRRPKAAATWCAIPAGATASGSAARRTVRSATTSRARVRKAWARTTRATSSPGLTGGCDASPSGGCLQKWVKK